MVLHKMAYCLGTMIPLPKGKWINLSCSGNYRAITIGSIFGNLLDFIILNKEEHQLNTSDLQFSSKKAHLLVYVLVLFPKTILCK